MASSSSPTGSLGSRSPTPTKRSPKSPKQSTPECLECAALLQAAHQASGPAMGHPEPAKMALFALPQKKRHSKKQQPQSESFLCIAYTAQCVFAQVLKTSSEIDTTTDNHNLPVELALLGNAQHQANLSVDESMDTDSVTSYVGGDATSQSSGHEAAPERITRLTVVALDETLEELLEDDSWNHQDSFNHDSSNHGDPMMRDSLFSNLDHTIVEVDSEEEEDEEEGDSDRMVEDNDDMDSEQGKASASSLQPNQGVDEAAAHLETTTSPASTPTGKGKLLLKGFVSTEPVQQRFLRVAVVFGTTESRLYSIELLLHPSSSHDDSYSYSLERLHADAGLLQVLPATKATLAAKMERRAKRGATTETPFRPRGGCVLLEPVNQNADALWIGHADGTLLQLSHAACFPSLWILGASRGGMSMDDLCDCPMLRRYRMQLPPLYADFQLQPYSSSVRTQLPLTKQHSTHQHQQQVLVYGSVQNTDWFPTACYYTTEQHFSTAALEHASDRPDYDLHIGRQSQSQSSSIKSQSQQQSSSLAGSVLGGTSRVVWGAVGTASGVASGVMGTATGVASGVVGTALGVFGLLRRSREQQDWDDTQSVQTTQSAALQAQAKGPFPSLHMPPVLLYCCAEWHDTPRTLERVVVHTALNLAAATDNLGRVVLMDLASKQVIRLFKGFREATCQWMEEEHDSDTVNGSVVGGSKKMQKKRVYLAIYSRQRRVLEVYEIPSALKVVSLAVDRDADLIAAVPSPLTQGKSSSSCWLLDSRVPGASNRLQRVRLDPHAAATQSAPTSPSSVSPRVGPARSVLERKHSIRVDALKMQHLQQLLSTTSVDFGQDDVYEAVAEIESLADLSLCLDLVGTSHVLEDRLGVVGSGFHQRVLEYCRETLVKQTKSSNAKKNPHVQTLTRKIDYHGQLVSAYDVLSKFAVHTLDDGYKEISNPSHWIAEAIGWATTFEHVTGDTMPSDAPSPKTVLHFTRFASSCLYPVKTADPSKVFFSDSSRTRRDVLVYVFRPLLADIYSVQTVYSLFSALGIRRETDYILQCFGEWFMTLSVQEAATRGLLGVNSPMNRFLQDVVIQQLGRNGKEKVLSVLFRFCEKSTDLVRAYMLATLCREAVKSSSAKKEKSSFGKVDSTRLTSDWEVLLRRLRVCLLVFLRLHRIRLAAPISIETVHEPDVFSVYEWLARDELGMSHNQEEIATLEKACRISSYAFDPSTPAGDGPSRFKMLQNSCLSTAISEEDRAEYLVDLHDGDRFGALLLYLGRHLDTAMLAAHRALLLSADWTRNYRDLDTLRDAYFSLKALKASSPSTGLVLAVAHEIWATRICPVFRAHLLGFDYVHELAEEAVLPLLENCHWLTIFGRIALDFIAILKESKYDDDAVLAIEEVESKAGDSPNSWPPVRHDFILKRLVLKTRRLDPSALGTHLVLVCGVLASENTRALAACVPEIHECFGLFSLYEPMTTYKTPTQQQEGFLQNAVISLAEGNIGQTVEGFDLGEVEAMSQVWGYDLRRIRAKFLLAMYELLKDRAVDDLLTKSASQGFVLLFMEDAVDIACKRLNSYLNGNRLTFAEKREVMGLLDADLCEWIQERTKESKSLTMRANYDSPIAPTHVFVLRLLSLSASSNVEPRLRAKIHSLSVLSGTLMKAAAQVKDKM